MPRDLDVLVVGDLNPDLILRGDVVPRFGQSEQLLESADLTLGGSGAIVAHGLARLGRRVALAAVIGEGPFGRGEVMKLLWDYIKAHNLQDPKDKRTILADAKLKPVFGGEDSVGMFKLAGIVGGHLG